MIGKTSSAENCFAFYCVSFAMFIKRCGGSYVKGPLLEHYAIESCHTRYDHSPDRIKMQELDFNTKKGK